MAVAVVVADAIFLPVEVGERAGLAVGPAVVNPTPRSALLIGLQLANGRCLRFDPCSDTATLTGSIAWADLPRLDQRHDAEHEGGKRQPARLIGGPRAQSTTARRCGNLPGANWVVIAFLKRP